MNTTDNEERRDYIVHYIVESFLMMLPFDFKTSFKPTWSGS